MHTNIQILDVDQAVKQANRATARRILADPAARQRLYAFQANQANEIEAVRGNPERKAALLSCGR